MKKNVLKFEGESDKHCLCDFCEFVLLVLFKCVNILVQDFIAIFLFCLFLEMFVFG